MKFRYPKTYEKDYVDYEKDMHSLQTKIILEEIDLQEMRSMHKNIKNKYQGRIFEEDRFSTKSFVKYLAYMIFKYGYGGLVTSLHERGHAKKAQKLGYPITYNCFSTGTDKPNKVFFRGYLSIPVDERLKIQDLEKIASGSGYLSLNNWDKEIINMLKERRK